ELPLDRPRPAVQSYVGDRVIVQLPAELSAGLRALAQQHGVTLFMILLAGWATLLARLGGQDEVVIGTPVANRQQAEVEQLIGFFVNTLALRVSLHDNLTVAELLEQVRNTTLDAYSHQDVPFEQVVETLRPERTLAYNPVFQAILSLNNMPDSGPLILPGLTLATVAHQTHTTHFDLQLALSDDGDVIRGTLTYATDLFDRTTIERFAGHLQTLLVAMVADSSQPLVTLPLLDAIQRTELLAAFNDTAVPYPRERLLHQLFEEQATAHPERIALICEQEQLTYDELNNWSNRIAHQLLSCGVQPDDRIALCVERGFAMMAGLLGILKAGAAYVPLDPSYPVERLSQVLEDSAPVALLTQSDLHAKLSLNAASLVLLDVSLEGPHHNPDVPHLTESNLAYVIYTSGSTGKPKGVMVEHRNIVNYLLWSHDSYYRTTPGGSPAVHSIGFDGLLTTLYGPLIAGQTLTLLPIGHEVSAITSGAARTPFGLIKVTPSHLKMLNAELAEHVSAPTRTLMVGGEALVPSDIAFWQRRFPQVRLINHFGPTEATVGCATFEITDDASCLTSIPIGHPIANTRIYILNRHGEVVPIGVTGELYVGGAGVARGYLNQPELSAERFMYDPFSDVPTARMYRTGDLGRWRADGVIEYLGRNDFQVKIRGFRIELGEIEARLTACDGVRDAVVIAREDTTGDNRLVAYILPDQNLQPTPTELRDRLSATLPSYMVPTAFVNLVEFPLTSNGKLDRKALPSPDRSAVPARAYEPPSDAKEVMLAAIWQELLGVERVGRNDNFFELGGHSLLVIKMIELLRRRDISADVRAIFRTPTLAALAEALECSHIRPEFSVPANPLADGCAQITPDLLPLVSLTQAQIDRIAAKVPGGAIEIQDIYPLAPLQEGILFHHLLSREGDAYLRRSGLRFDSRDHLDRFLAALQCIVDRHDILRSSVHWEGLERAVQVVHRQAPLAVREVVLESASQVHAQLMTLTNKLRLELSSAPLLVPFVAAAPGSSTWHMLLVCHHVVTDHVSLELLTEEVRMLLQYRDAELATPVPYRNFIAQLSVQPQSDHERYFRARLGDIDEPSAPFGILEVHGTGGDLRHVRVAVAAELAQRIRKTVRHEGVNAAALFHLAWAQVIAKCCSRDDVVFGTMLFGRMRGGNESHRGLGMFINTLPIRLSLRGRSAKQALAETFQSLTDLLEHEHAPLALAQRCSAISPSMPLFTTLLNFRHSTLGGTQRGDSNYLDGISLLGGEERNNYPVTISIDDLGSDFAISAQCAGSIDPEMMVCYLTTAIASLVDALESRPDHRVTELGILSEAQRRQLLLNFNETDHDYPHQRLVHHLFEDQVARQPESTAVVFEDERLSYRELNRRANRLAHALLAKGVGPDVRVALCVERSPEMLIGLFAVLKAGGAYVPVDPSHPPDRLTYILQDSAPAVLLTQRRFEQTILSTMGIPTLLLDGWELDLDTSHETNPTSSVQLNHLAYVIYTSGSTGMPKGVMVEHRGLYNYLQWAGPAYTPCGSTRALVFSPLAFDATITSLYLPLLNGGMLTLIREGQELQEVEGHLAAGDPWDLVKITPAHLALLGQRLKAARARPAVALFVVGGEALAASTVTLWQQIAPNTRIINEYGPTETVVGCSVFEADEASTTKRDIPIGKPIANVQMYVLDAQMQPVPLEVEGEIYIGGAGVARGYLNRPQLTAERFLPNPFSAVAEARIYKTGDLGRWLPNGNIEYLGRNDFQIKIRGYRVELGEIEAKLAICPGVREAVVVAREDSPSDKRLVAYVIPLDGAQLDVRMLTRELATHLPDYMMPAAFVLLDALPLTTNGKLNRKALPMPDRAVQAEVEYEEPQDEIEKIIATIWEELLELENIGRNDHFFELGGHSLLAIQFMVRLTEQLGTTPPLAELFASPVLSEFASSVTEALIASCAVDDVDALLDPLNGLSEDELLSLLKE
ncbi:amino acid adenylation domain-containing protein, partial [Massilia aurea]